MKIYKAVYKIDENETETYFNEIKQDINAKNEKAAKSKAEKNARQFTDWLGCLVNFVGLEKNK